MAATRPKSRDPKTGRNLSYEIRVSLGRDADGVKKICKSMTWRPTPGMTERQEQRELERQALLFEERVKNGVCPSSTMRFAELSARWMEDYAKPNLSPSTYNRYVEYLKRINQAIGHIKLKDLRPLHLNAFYKNLAEPGINKHYKKDENGKPVGDRRLAPKTIQDHHRVVSAILNWAVKSELIDRNVASGATVPKVTGKDIEYLDEEQTRRLLQLLNGEPMQYRTMITLLIYTGLRRGELNGLEWQDIDFNARTLTVSRSSLYTGNGQTITKEPKTRSGKRKLTLSNAACALLLEYKKWQDQRRADMGDQWIESGRLFTKYNGEPIHPQTISDWFAKFLKRHPELPKVRLHSLRHTNATLLISEGVDIRTVSSRLGHAQTSTTLNIYTHALQSRDAAAADCLDHALSTSTPDNITPLPVAI